MTVRRFTFFLWTLGALVLAAGCSRDDPQTLIAETDEPLYAQAHQLKRQGRNAEALVNFLKVIEKRGDQFSAESHLEAGLIYLHHDKDYIEAIHHFKKYLSFEPNSRQAAGVRELVDTATREFVRAVLGRLSDDFSARPESAAELEQLRRENDELRAQVATLRGGGAVLPRGRSRALTIPNAPSRPAAGDDSPFTLSPVPTTPAPTAPEPRPILRPPAQGAGRVHVVRPGDTLFAIARQADPVSTSKKVQDIVEANRRVLPQGVNTPLHAGMELTIP